MDSPKSSKLFLHHAYYLIGSDSVRTELLSVIEENHRIKREANPDFFDRAYENFVIDDAREVKSFHGMRPVTETGKKIFILRMNGITVEAQNALLKLLEEPAEYAHFFIIIPSAHLLLPTVKSRMQLMGMKEGEWRGEEGGRRAMNGVGMTEKIERKIKDGGRVMGNKGREIENDKANLEFRKIAERLISLSKAKRLEEIKKFIDDISKEKKTKQDAIELLNAIQMVVYETRGVREGKSALETIELARNYIHDRAPSVKMLLEYVMLGL